MKDIERLNRNKGIVNLYASGSFMTERIAAIYDVTPKTVQRLAKDAGVLRTQAESNKLMAPQKNFRKVPEELRVKRKHLSLKLRYETIKNHPFCTVCGLTPDKVRLEVDHKDNNPTNNNETNLQVLCERCNKGKSYS